MILSAESVFQKILERYATIRLPLEEDIREMISRRIDEACNWQGEYVPGLAAYTTRGWLAQEVLNGKYPRLASLLAAKVVEAMSRDALVPLVPEADPSGDPT